jgi:nucleotide-binding universal stress UspA family protein
MIVVGVDGSKGAQSALSWALAEARLRQTALRVVSAWEVPVLIFGAAPAFAPPLDPTGDPDLALAAERTIEDALRELAAATEGVEVERVVVNGHAAPILVDASREAELLVVGSRGLGGFTGLLLGSVSQHSVHHAHCPVVVIPKVAS